MRIRTPALWILGLLASGVVSSAADLHVSTSGSDDNPGTVERPFATVQRALRESRELRRNDAAPVRGVTIHLHEGTHTLSEPLILGPEDAGTPSSPLVVTGQSEGGPAVLSGGRELTLHWKPYRDGIFLADVPGDLSFEQLFVNGSRQILARYPNARADGGPFDGTAPDAVSKERIRGWQRPVGAYLHALHRGRWGGMHYRITGVSDSGEAILEGGWQNNRRSEPHPSFRFVENVFEELDAPGEWYLDAEARRLYFMPPDGVDLSTAIIVVPQLFGLIELRGSAEHPVRSVHFKNITFRHTRRTFMETKEPLLRSDWTIYRGGAVMIEGGIDCSISDCVFDAIGGNGIFVSRYNRRVAVKSSKFSEAGASAICFVGDPGAVRSPSFEYNQFVPESRMDLTPGPQSGNYPADCLAEDNLIFRVGRFEKQVAGIQISMAEEIVVRHNSIYETPRAGINISEGTWGGHLIERNDVFDTVLETGDHGAINSWGRDRYWLPNRGTTEGMVREHPTMPTLDARKTTVIRGNRFRCDHGWDIDLDDGSSNYHIYNNLCLNGGLKLREGYYRTVEHNVILNNGFHPHVWYKDSHDVFRNNLCGAYHKPIGMPAVWGDMVDYNLFFTAAVPNDWQQNGLDGHSAVAAPRFIDPTAGDYRVKTGSPALELGFKNFPMTGFGVRTPRWHAEARTPALPEIQIEAALRADGNAARPAHRLPWFGGTVRNLAGPADLSATGMAEETGVLIERAPDDSKVQRAGLRPQDVLLKLNGRAIQNVAELLETTRTLRSGTVTAQVFRNQQTRSLELHGFFD